MKNNCPANEDDFDYEYSHNKKQEFEAFLYSLCGAKEIKFVGYNDNPNIANVGVDTEFIMAKDDFAELIKESNYFAFERLQQLYEHLDKNIILTSAMQDYMDENFPNDKFYIEVNVNFDYPRFSKKGLEIFISEDNMIEQPYYYLYEEIREVGNDILYSLFKEWFKGQFEKDKLFEFRSKLDNLDTLKKSFLRDNIFEQEMVINHIKQIINKEKLNET